MSKKGKILISEPFLGDPNFERTVILLVEDNEEGSLGFVMNKPSVLTVEIVLSDLIGFKQNLLIGGPVEQDSVHFIYQGEQLMDDSVELEEGIYWGGSFERLFELADLKLVNPDNFKFFLGYSGWGEGQLETEMESNSWIIGAVTIKELLSMDMGNMWQTILKNMGGKYKMYSNFPLDPRLN